MFKLKNRGSIYDLTKTKKIGLFIGLLIAQQLPIFIYKVFYYGQMQFVGLILTIIASGLIIKIPLSFEEFKQKTKLSKKKKMAIIILSLITIIALLGTLQPFFATIFNLETTNTANQNQENINMFYQNILSTIAITIFTLIVAPIIEEFQFRGLIINPNTTKQKQKKQQIIAIVGFALLHTGLYFPYVLLGQINLFAWMYTNISYLIFGLVFSSVYRYTRNLRMSLAVHIAWNCIASLLILLT